MATQDIEQTFFDFFQKESRFYSQNEIFSQTEIRNFYELVLEEGNIDETLEKCKHLLTEISPCIASDLALLCGAWVEDGGDPKICLDSCFALLKILSEKVLPYVANKPEGIEKEETATPKKGLLDSLSTAFKQLYEKVLPTSQNPVEAGEINEEETRHWNETQSLLQNLSKKERKELEDNVAAINLLVLPLMTMLMRAKECRKKYVSGDYIEYDIIERLYYSETLEMEELYYLEQAFHISDIDSVFVIFPPQNIGIEVAIEGINNNFHFFTLLQDVIKEKAKDLGLQIETKQRGREEAHYHYLQANAYTKGNCTANMLMAWGEAAVYQNTTKNGQAILIADKMQMKSRSWSGFVDIIHDAQKSSVTFKRILYQEEIEACLQ